jgi:hypothetical protein
VFNRLVLGVGYCECTIDSPACASARRIVADYSTTWIVWLLAPV